MKNYVVDCRTLGIVDQDTKFIEWCEEAIVISNTESDPLRSPMEEDPLLIKEDRISISQPVNRAINSDDASSLTQLAIDGGRSKRDEEPKLYDCPTCNLHFERPVDCKRHMVKHSNLRPYECGICDLAFKRPSDMYSHRRIHRNIEHACDVCGFITNSKVSLRMHHRRMHKRDFRYQCDQCNKGFMSNYDLQDHKASHLGEKTFFCDHCGNAFSQRSHLMKHKRNIHGIHKDSAKLFQCDICQQNFTSKHYLCNHLKLHSKRFQCAECEREFPTNYKLKEHSRTHTGEKPYTCDVCSKGFSKLCTLKAHKVTHTGEKPYLCDWCGTSFAWMSSMLAHRRKHPRSYSPTNVLLDVVQSDTHK